MSHERNSYAEVGRAMRAAVARAHATGLSERDLRVFDAVLVVTASWSRLSDETSTRQIAALAYSVPYDDVHDEQRRRAGKSLRKLARLGIIEYVPGRGHWARCRVGLSLVDDPSNGVVSDPVNGIQRVRLSRPTGSTQSSNGVAGVSHPRSTPRSNPRGRDRKEENSRSEVLRAFGPYKCPLGLGCDNGNIWDAQKNGVVRCECIKRKFTRHEVGTNTVPGAAEAATP